MPVRWRTGGNLTQNTAVVIPLHQLVWHSRSLSPRRPEFVLIMQIHQLASVLYVRICKYWVTPVRRAHLKVSKDLINRHQSSEKHREGRFIPLCNSRCHQMHARSSFFDPQNSVFSPEKQQKVSERWRLLVSGIYFLAGWSVWHAAFHHFHATWHSRTRPATQRLGSLGDTETGAASLQVTVVPLQVGGGGSKSCSR